MTYINHIVYQECFDLGTRMGLGKELLEKVILWSVGTCWVTDNYKDYQPDAGILKKMAVIETNLNLMTTRKILSTFKTEPL